MLFRRSLLALAFAVALAPSPARADTVILKNGHEIHGRLLEERKDVIVMRVEGGGTMPIRKADVASFFEGEVLVDYGGKARAQPQPGQAPPPAGTPATPAQPTPAQPGQPVAPAGGGATADDWTWPAGLSPAQLEELTAIRDEVLEELEKLGPTAEERLEATTLSAEERSELQEQITYFNWHRRQGSANMRRENAKKRALAFGVKAIPQLVEALRNESQWTKRISAQALGELAGATSGDLKAEDVRWLMYHFDAPAQLVAALDHQGEVDSPFVRQDADASLRAITGHTVNFQPSTERLRTQAETQAKTAWERWWTREKARWTRAEADKVKMREELSRKLALLRQGKNPETDAPR